MKTLLQLMGAGVVVALVAIAATWAYVYQVMMCGG
jgi:hypothetical protein